MIPYIRNNSMGHTCVLTLNSMNNLFNKTPRRTQKKIKMKNNTTIQLSKSTARNEFIISVETKTESVQNCLNITSNN